MKDDKVLMVGNEKAGYQYSIGGRIRFGETMEEAIVREVLEETGVKMEIDRLGFVQESYFYGRSPSNLGKLVYQISFYFYMNVPDDFVLNENIVMEDNSEEHLIWSSLDEDIQILPEFFKTELKNPSKHIKRFVTDER
jgi:ADP-ribose pyrophosphatase YjhB (NUDIX family)